MLQKLFFFSLKDKFIIDILYTVNKELIQEKIGFENRPFTKIYTLKTDPKIKIYKVIFHICSVANVLTMKLLKNFTKLNFFIEKK